MVVVDEGYETDGKKGRVTAVSPPHIPARDILPKSLAGQRCAGSEHGTREGCWREVVAGGD